MAGDKQKYIDRYGTVTLNGEEHYLEDGDTWKSLKTGETFRAQGFDTEEVYHAEGQPIKAPGTVTGYAQTMVVADAMREKGFTQQTSEGYGTFGRTLGAVHNEDNDELMSSRLYAEGIVRPNAYTSQEDLDLYLAGRERRENDPDSVDPYWAKKRLFIDDVRQNFDAFVPKLTAVNEVEFKGSPGLYSGVHFRSYDRDLKNQANSPFVSGVRQGLLGIQQSYYGAKALVGDLVDADELYQSSMIEMSRIEQEQMKAPEYVKNYKDIHSVSDTLDYISGQAGVALPYMLGIIASYGGGAVLGGTQAAKYALGTIAPSLIYSGEVYSSMEGPAGSKNAGAALSAGVAMAALDVLGVSLLFKPSHLMTQYGKNKVAKQYIKENPTVSLKDALINIEEVLKRTSLASYDGLAKLAKVALGREGLSKLLQSTLQNTGKGALTEGVTEVAQEGLGYATSVFGSEAKWDPARFEEIVINAGIGGATLGGGFGTVSGAGGGYRDFKKVVNAGSKASYDAKLGVETYNEKAAPLKESIKRHKATLKKTSLSDEDREVTELALETAELELAALGDQPKTTMHTVTSLIQQEKEKVGAGPHRDRLNTEMEATKDLDTLKVKGWAKFLKELPRRAVDAGADFIQHKLMNNFQGHSSILQSIEKAILGYVNTGTSYAAGAHLALERLRFNYEIGTRSGVVYKNIISLFEKRYPNALGKNDFRGILNEMKAFHEAYNKGVTDAKLAKMFPELNIEEAKKISNSIGSFLTDFRTKVQYKLDNGEFNTKAQAKEVEINEDWFWKPTEFNIDFVAKNKARFIEKATNVLGSKTLATNAYEASFAVANTHDATRKRLGIGETRYTPFEMRRVSERAVADIELLINDPSMAEFMHTDLEAQSAQKINRITKYATDIEYRGQDDITIAKLLAAYKKQATKEGVYDARVLHHITGLLDAMDGNYKPLESDAIANAQENITMINGLNQLEGAAFPSLVEFVTAFFRSAGTGNSAEVIRKAVREGIVPLFKNNVQETVKYFKAGSGMSLQEHHRNVASFYESGQASHEGGVMAKLDVEPASKIKARIMKVFFSLILLKHVTDFSRITRWALANDAIVQDLEIVALYWNENGSNTEFVNDAYDRLRDLRIDPVKTANEWKGLASNPDVAAIFQMHKNKGEFQNIYGEKERSEIDGALFDYIKQNHASLEASLSLARQSFVEMTTVRPDTTTKPMWALNPRYRLLTQYTSYIMAFQSQALPKIWKDVKSSDPDIQFATVQMMAYMLLVAFMAQELKDLWKFGEENPYLSDERKAYRGVMQSGLLGSVHRPIEWAVPVYPVNSNKGSYTFSKFKNDVLSRLKSAAGPTASTTQDLYGALAATFEGDGDKAEYKWKRMVPILGGTRGYTGKPPY